jgi:2-epi-5-epi-valiolone synthase
LGLPTTSSLLDAEVCLKALQETARHRGGRPNLVIPSRIGSATFVRRLDQLPLSLLRQSLDYLSTTARAA